MRSVWFRSVVVVTLSVVLAAGALAAPRAGGPQHRGVRAVKKVIKALGDFITVPVPAPKTP